MKTVTIEELLTWAFVHELPKGGGVEGLSNANSAWNTIVVLGTRIDSGSAGIAGGTNYFIEQGEPNQDAVALGRAVADLAACDVQFRPGWNALADWPADDPRLTELAAAASAKAVERYLARPRAERGRALVTLVIGVAILGRAPDWSAPVPRVRMVERGGKPAWFTRRTIGGEMGSSYVAEVDGRDPRTRRPIRGAYRKFELSTDPTGDIMSRIDWDLWVAALRRLQAVVGPQLVAHRLAPLDRRASPWLAPVEEAALVLACETKVTRPPSSRSHLPI